MSCRIQNEDPGPLLCSRGCQRRQRQRRTKRWPMQSSVEASGDWKHGDVGSAQRQGHWSSHLGGPWTESGGAKCKWPLTQRRGTPGRRPTSAKDRDPDARADWKAEVSAERTRLQSSDSCGKRRPCRWLGERHRGRTIGVFEACSWRILLSLGSLKGAQRQRNEISLLN